MNVNLKQFCLTAFALLLFPLAVLATPVFDTAVTYELGALTSEVVSADFDGDGDLDLAVGLSYAVAILKNNGNGTFASPIHFEAGIEAYAVATSDLDADGDFDLIVANNFLNSISILKNNGDGTFADTINYQTGKFPCSIAATDLDGDGDIDLAVANLVTEDTTDYGISVFRNNGDGTFASKVNYGASYGSWAVVAADFDADGDVDLAASGATYKNNGEGTFGSKIEYGVLNVAAVFASDLDGDGDIDLATANCCQQGVSILNNDGNGTFTIGTSYPPTDYNLYSITGADFDGDGDVDLVVANGPPNVNNPSSTVSVFGNNGDCTFTSQVDYTVGRFPVSVYPADLDGDGDFDMVVSNREDSSVSVLKNLTNVPVCPSVKGDLNADGQLAALDVVLILNCVFLKYGVCNLCFTDVNCDGILAPSDIVLELNRIFLGTPFSCI